MTAPRKRSKTTRALIFFSLILMRSIVGMVVMIRIFHPFYYIHAINLNQEPEQYTLLENPDSYTLQAINTGHSITFYSSEDTDFDEKQHENIERIGFKYFNYFEYNNNYYSIWLVAGDKFPPPFLPILLLAGIGISAPTVVILSAITTKQMKNRQTDVG